MAILNGSTLPPKLSPFVAGRVRPEVDIGLTPALGLRVAADYTVVFEGSMVLQGFTPGLAADPVLKGSVMTMARRMAIKLLALLLVPALLAACNPFGLRDLLEAATRATLSIDPTDVTMPSGATLTFSAKGGVPGDTYSILSGGSIDPTTGDYTSPLVAGTAVIRVTDAAGATADTGITITGTGSACTSAHPTSRSS